MESSWRVGERKGIGLGFRVLGLGFRVYAIQVPGVSFLSDMVAPLYTCGVDTGLVVDVGYSKP